MRQRPKLDPAHLINERGAVLVWKQLKHRLGFELAANESFHMSSGFNGTDRSAERNSSLPVIAGGVSAAADAPARKAITDRADLDFSVQKQGRGPRVIVHRPEPGEIYLNQAGLVQRTRGFGEPIGIVQNDQTALLQPLQSSARALKAVDTVHHNNIESFIGAQDRCRIQFGIGNQEDPSDWDLCLAQGFGARQHRFPHS